MSKHLEMVEYELSDIDAIVEKTGIQPASIEGVATFYTQFRRDPVGKHVISLCDGTACHVKGSLDILEVLSDEIGMDVGQRYR